MDIIDRENILDNIRRLDEWENTPLEPASGYDDMSMRELKLLITQLTKMLQDEQRKSEAKDAEIARLLEMLSRSERDNAALREDISSLIDGREADRVEMSKLRMCIEELQKKLIDSINQAKSDRGARFGSQSQKGTGRKVEKKGQDKSSGSDEGKDNGSDDNGSDEDRKSSSEEKESMSDRDSVELLPETEFKDGEGNPEEPKAKIPRPYRKGMKHSKPHADRKVFRYSDRNLLPDGYTFSRFGEKSVFKKVTEVVEVVFQTVIAIDEEGNEFEFYLPSEQGEDKVIDCFPNTMASSEMMSECVVDHYVLNIPFYRQWKWLNDCGLHLVRQTYINWMYQGYDRLKNMIPVLLDMAVQKDSIINCDETWCKVKVKGKYRKRYTWCLVNRQLGIVIYFYKDGARSRDAFKDILDDRRPMAVQTDGYNVYLYIENELEDVTHLCCMAHARAKFRKAWEIAGELEALFFLDNIGFLYGRERHYKTMGYDAGKIKEERNSARNLAVLGDMRTRLTELLKEGHPPRSELLDQALRYMDSFWTQLVEYTKDGRYEIDNSEAERGMRQLANERKNSSFFGSHKMAAASAVYHTLIATCRKTGVSIKEYFKKLFSEIIHGNKNWAQLLPMTIGMPVNKI